MKYNSGNSLYYCARICVHPELNNFSLKNGLKKLFIIINLVKTDLCL